MNDSRVSNSVDPDEPGFLPAGSRSTGPRDDEDGSGMWIIVASRDLSLHLEQTRLLDTNVEQHALAYSMCSLEDVKSSIIKGQGIVALCV